MITYRLEMKRFKSLVTRKVDGEEVYNEIMSHLRQGEQVIVDFEEIDTMTTYFAKQVFGKLYIELGAAAFGMQIKFDEKKMTEDVALVVKIGIKGALTGL